MGERPSDTPGLGRLLPAPAAPAGALLAGHRWLCWPVNPARSSEETWGDEHEVKISFSKQCNMCGTLFFVFVPFLIQV